MKNVRKRIRIDLHRKENERSILRLITNPGYKGLRIYEKGLTAIHSIRSICHLNKPIFLGQSILDYSKYTMYNFYYNVIKKMYPGDRSKLIYTDTDSLVLRLETPDVYQDQLNNNQYFDLSEYNKGHIRL